MPYLHPHSGGIIGIGSVCKGKLWKEPTTHLVTLWALGLWRICRAEGRRQRGSSLAWSASCPLPQ